MSRDTESAWELQREAATHLAHASSLLLDPRPSAGKLAGALVHCSLAMLCIARADHSERARGLAEAWVESVRRP